MRLRTVTVQAGLDSPGQLAAWRLGMAHVAPFVAALPAARRAELRRAAAAAAAGTGPLIVSMLVLTRLLRLSQPRHASRPAAVRPARRSVSA